MPDEIVGIPPGFQGFAYVPTNEQETVGLFVRLLPLLKPSWCVLQLQTGFPDATFYDTERRTEIRAEFEYLASHFVQHRHDPQGCHILICWENDLAPAIARRLGLEVVTLRQEQARLSDRTVCLGWKRETGLDASVRALVKAGDRGAQAVEQLISEGLPRLQAKHPGLFVDASLSRHYMVKWDGKALLGVYPSGKLVAMTREQYHRQFGEAFGGAGEQFRQIVKEKVQGLNVTSKASDGELQERLRILVDAVDELCARFEAEPR